MNWFKSFENSRKPVEMGTIAAFCAKCGKAFKPRDDKYANLCLEHAQPMVDADRQQRHFLELCERFRDMPIVKDGLTLHEVVMQMLVEHGAAQQATAYNAWNEFAQAHNQMYGHAPQANCYPQGAYNDGRQNCTNGIL